MPVPKSASDKSIRLFVWNLLFIGIVSVGIAQIFFTTSKFLGDAPSWHHPKSMQVVCVCSTLTARCKLLRRACNRFCSVQLQVELQSRSVEDGKVPLQFDLARCRGTALMPDDLGEDGGHLLELALG